MTLISKWNYGEYSSNNYGANSIAISVGGMSFYFSYNTLIAFNTMETGLVISENIWSTTTGKHLNWINRDKSLRIPNTEFEKRLTEILKKHKLVFT